MCKEVAKIRIGFILLFVFFVCTLFAQEGAKNTLNRSTIIGIGKSILKDTYLSPLEYTGTEISLLNERLGKTSFKSNSLLIQRLFAIDVAFTKNPTHTSSEYYGNISYVARALYPVFEIDKFRFLAGGGGEASLGGIYNVRNSNNPGSLKAFLHLDISGMALYNIDRFTFRWQISTPFLGMFFSPGYGQSYYEIFTLGNDGGTVHLSSFYNCIAFKNYFTVDIPFNNITVRTGYLGNYYRTNANDIFTRISSHQFILGFVVETLNFSGKRAKNNNLIKSVYY